MESALMRGVKSPSSSRWLQTDRSSEMGKYLIGWMLGVPVIVLVIIFIFFH